MTKKKKQTKTTNGKRPTTQFVPQFDMAKLNPNPNNPRIMLPQEMDKLRRSLEKFGFVDPIIVRAEDNTIIGGHQRVEAAKAEGWTEPIPVMLVKGLTDEEAVLLSLALNKISGQFDESLLTDLFTQLDIEMADVLEFDMTLSGFSEDEIQSLFDEPSDTITEDEVPEVAKKAISKTGDLWLLGNHRLLCGDSTKAEDVERVMGGECIAALLTDPPYGIDVVGKNGKIGADGLAKTNTYAAVIGDSGPFDPSHLIGAAPVVVLWGANNYANRLPDSTGWIVWDKREGMASNMFADVELAWTNQHRPARMFSHRWSGMIKKGESGKRCHPTQKPIALMVWLIEEYTTEGIVGDWYCGSGTTIIAAEQLNRKCYAIEIEPLYVDVAVKRWENLTGEKAVLERKAKPPRKKLGAQGRKRPRQPTK